MRAQGDRPPTKRGPVPTNSHEFPQKNGKDVSLPCEGLPPRHDDPKPKLDIGVKYSKIRLPRQAGLPPFHNRYRHLPESRRVKTATTPPSSQGAKRTVSPTRGAAESRQPYHWGQTLTPQMKSNQGRHQGAERQVSDSFRASPFMSCPPCAKFARQRSVVPSAASYSRSQPAPPSKLQESTSSCPT